jgi:replicative DNA helicase
MSEPVSTSAPLVVCEPALVSADTPRLIPLADVLQLALADNEAAHAAVLAGRPRGAVSGLPWLDRELGGSFTPGLHVLHGEPGTGKTALALQIAASAACPALFVTTEMGPAELFRRHMARVTSTFLGRLRSGELSPDAFAGLAEKAAAAAPMLAFLDATRAYADADLLRELSTLWRDRHEGADHLLLVVDSLHSWTNGAPSSYDAGTEYEKLNAAVTILQRLGLELNAAVLAVVERNRASMDSASQSAGAGTRRIEYGAETVLAIQREHEGNEKHEWKPDAAGEYSVHLKVAKNRNGATGPKCSLRFHGALQVFREV